MSRDVLFPLIGIAVLIKLLTPRDVQERQAAERENSGSEKRAAWEMEVADLEKEIANEDERLQAKLDASLASDEINDFILVQTEIRNWEKVKAGKVQKIGRIRRRSVIEAAKAAGLDVCEDCLTIEPRRCSSCGACDAGCSHSCPSDD